MCDLKKILEEYKNSKIAIYGLGTETERVLAEVNGVTTVIGLLDGFCEQGELYGKPIISLQNAVEQEIKLILVVARQGSCKAIAKRIEKTCLENNISLVDVRGNNLCEHKRVTYNFKNTQGVTKKFFKEMIGGRDIISVDLFDTLLTRKIFFQTDIIEVVYARLNELGIRIDDFCNRRLESEKYLAKTGQPTLKKIYAYMAEKYKIDKYDCGKLAEIEWNVDKEFLVPRYDVCDILKNAHQNGTKIYIISDTYYSKQQLEELLGKFNIRFYDDIFASCEYNTGKTQQLFSIAKGKLGLNEWLHIGDDIIADVDSAKKNGLETCRLYSVSELLELSGYLGLWESTNCICDKIKIGMAASKLFNSPFQFEQGDKRISISR